jgi:hypothetical protein
MSIMLKVIKWAFVLLIMYLLGVLLFAPKNDSEILAEHEIKAKKIFKFNCAMCHGNSGQGNGPSAIALPINPPDWSNSFWQKSVTDFGITQAIIGGGNSIGRSQFMPAHPELANTPELEALVKLIREFDKK